MKSGHIFLFFFTLKLSVLGQTLSQNDLRDEVKKETLSLDECFKDKKSLDSLIEWKFEGEDGRLIAYEHKGRLAFFRLGKNSDKLFLESIQYTINSFQKKIFMDGLGTTPEVTRKTQYRVWISKDNRKIYFCVINSDNALIWILENHNNISFVECHGFPSMNE